MEKWQWLVDTFTVIGMLVCIIITLIALVWVTAFAVKLLIKTFSVKVGSSYDIMVEDINKKAEAKKTRKEIARNNKFERKMELLKMKEESKEKIHEMKKQKLAEKLAENENNAKIKLFGEENQFVESKKKENVKVQSETLEDEEIVDSKDKVAKTQKSKKKVEEIDKETTEETNEE